MVDFEYKCIDYYDPDDEGSIAWDDPDLAIACPTGLDILLSAENAGASSFCEFRTA